MTRTGLWIAAVALAVTPGVWAQQKNPTAVIETSAGNLRCELFQDKVPQAVANFIGLAEGSKDWADPRTKTVRHGVPLYDGTVFHRVIPGMMIQGGDPAGTGAGDIGFKVNDEFVANLKFDRPGRLAYANSGPNTNAAQFFITEAPNPAWDPCLNAGGCRRADRKVPQGYGYTIFGQCDTSAISLVEWIAKAGRDLETDRPIRPVVIKHVTIVKPGA